MMDNGRFHVGAYRLTFHHENPLSAGPSLTIRICARGAITALLVMICSGCSASNLFVSAGPSPRVENCLFIQHSTPTKFACDGEIYTSNQLADIRNGGTQKSP
jgi:hypothetical protein